MSESFNNFIQFVAFGNKGIIAENSRDEQRKIIRYGHLVANSLIFMNVYDQTVILNKLIKEGYKITPEVLKSLSPYRTGNINRFGAYYLNENRDKLHILYGLDGVAA